MSAALPAAATSTFRLHFILQLRYVGGMASKRRVKLPSATAVVARSYPDRIIGVDNALPWHLRTDLRHFKFKTSGHAVIMGRKTFESIGHPLPNRLNIVLSRSQVNDSSTVRWAPNPETALLIADAYTISNMKKEFFVIGGENIYNVFYIYINRAWVTDVFTGSMNGDAKFEEEFIPKEWWTPYEREFPATEFDEFAFRISFYMRKKEVHRTMSREEFMRKAPEATAKLDQWQRMISHEPVVPPREELQISLF